jgi:subtilisin-like proprotein convertase family protein
MPRARATTAAGLALLTAATAAISLAVAGPAQAATATYASATPVPIGGSHQVLHASGSIVINDGKASAYPIQTAEYVDGLAGTVTDVDLHLENFSHERPDDVDLMLVSPSGVASVVMSDVAAGGIPATDLDIVLDDEAPQQLPTSGALQSTSYRPLNAAGGDSFASPAPAGIVGSTLSAFDGTDPTGSWQLFVYDDQFDYFGKVPDWTLDVTTSGPAPYPSTITVSGAPTTTFDVDVTLSGLSHPDLTEVDVLLVGPTGQQATVLSDAVGSGPYTDLSLTLDDAAPTYVMTPGSSGGTYRPTNLGATPDQFPAPAPAATGTTTLSGFNGTDPNGQWKLYVVDDSEGFGGSLDGWSLRITTNDPAPSPTPTAPTPTAPSPTPTAGGSGGAGADGTAPRVAATRPASSTTAVRRGADITATLTEAARPGTVSRSTAYLVRKGSSKHLAATVTYRPGTRQVVIDPATRLRGHTTYRAVVTTAVKDRAGNRLDQDATKTGLQAKAWRFTTR